MSLTFYLLESSAIDGHIVVQTMNVPNALNEIVFREITTTLYEARLDLLMYIWVP